MYLPHFLWPNNMHGFQQKNHKGPEKARENELEDLKQSSEIRLRHNTDVGSNREEIKKKYIKLHVGI